eukprot:gnl/TRDRNA2_/TRDRNA2_194566_c0_seq1.p1 gnl/TRDRNA2_/TRDRNA2_194566_c0~~gnl/TRDRNA2_/TRDRNA2_194566_c0_seq1.p1  ORF type:complete len:237 (-),score=16.65 gnl/TRDRNA2_/TRDRNA2_194566_c0_seq1:298-978(-)
MAEVQSSASLCPWSLARAALDADPMGFSVSGCAIGNTDGCYELSSKTPAVGPPVFHYRACGRWLYVDVEGRWRVGLAGQMEPRRGDNCGYLRSAPVHPGTLPSDASDWEVFARGRWNRTSLVCVTPVSIVHRVSGAEPCDLVATLSTLPCESDELTIFTCTSMGGSTLATLKADPTHQPVFQLHRALAAAMNMPPDRLKLVLPNGELLSVEDKQKMLACVVKSAGS